MKTLMLLRIGLRSRLSSCKGQTMTEYALILAAVAVIAYAGFEAIGSTTLAGVLDEIVEELR
jgi:Flp pilus assembly pilin Flp